MQVQSFVELYLPKIDSSRHDIVDADLNLNPPGIDVSNGESRGSRSGDLGGADPGRHV